MFFITQILAKTLRNGMFYQTRWLIIPCYHYYSVYLISDNIKEISIKKIKSNNLTIHKMSS